MNNIVKYVLSDYLNRIGKIMILYYYKINLFEKKELKSMHQKYNRMLNKYIRIYNKKELDYWYNYCKKMNIPNNIFRLKNIFIACISIFKKLSREKIIIKKWEFDYLPELWKFNYK